MHAHIHMLMMAMKMCMKMKMTMTAVRTVGSGMITDHASIVFANGGGVSAPNPPPLPRCLKPFWKPALHNMSLFAPPPFYHAGSMFASGGGSPHQPPACASLLDSM